MSKERFTKAQSRDRAPAAEAQRYYGEAFGVRRREELAESMAEWAELSEEEQSFAVAHLVYLGVQQAGRVERLLEEVRDLVEEGIEDLPDDVVVPELVEEVPPPPVLEVVTPEAVVPEGGEPEVPDDAA